MKSSAGITVLLLLLTCTWSLHRGTCAVDTAMAVSRATAISAAAPLAAKAKAGMRGYVGAAARLSRPCHCQPRQPAVALRPRLIAPARDPVAGAFIQYRIPPSALVISCDNHFHHHHRHSFPDRNQSTLTWLHCALII